jgi:hypothetical protein
LVLKLPEPVKKIIGEMSNNSERMLPGLDVRTKR